MAVGDTAAAAGYPLVPDSGEDGRVRWGAREINRTRDFVAQVKALIPALPSTSWTVYTPSTSGLVGGTATGRWRYINAKLIEVWIHITAGTIQTQGVASSASLPPGKQGDTWLRQPVLAEFNAERLVLARVEAGSYAIHISSTDADGTDWPAGTHMSNTIIKGIVAIQ